jgi:thioesterase domain-containing protein/acyl carrier protein
VVRVLLHVDRVGRDDDLFDLGADSLDLLELLAAIHESYGVDLPARVLLEGPTVALLAAQITHPVPMGESTVVPVLPGGTKTPFFCVPASGAPAFGLRPLAAAIRRVDDRPVYALVAHGVEHRARPDRSIVAAARRQVENLRAVQADGPYLVGGYSGGGIVAYEIAQQLRRAGETVALLVLLDTFVGSSWSTRTHIRARAARAHELWPDTDPRSRWRRGRYVAHHVVPSPRTVYRRVTAGIVRRRGRPQRETFRALQSWMRRRYRLAPYDGRLLLVAAADRPSDMPDPRLPSADGDLRENAPGLEVVSVGGDHDTMISPGYVDEVADVLIEAFAPTDA